LPSNRTCTPYCVTRTIGPRRSYVNCRWWFEVIRRCLGHRYIDKRVDRGPISEYRHVAPIIQTRFVSPSLLGLLLETGRKRGHHIGWKAEPARSRPGTVSSCWRIDRIGSRKHGGTNSRKQTNVCIGHENPGDAGGDRHREAPAAERLAGIPCTISPPAVHIFGMLAQV